MTCKIFLNYRRDTDRHAAGRLCERLNIEFGPDNVFLDVQGSIKPGDNFAEKISEKVSSCDVLLAVMGQGWLDAKDPAGGNRLSNPNDFVRIEIASALEQEKLVIPVLVDDAPIPHRDLLPEPLKELADRHAVRLSHETFVGDCDPLMGRLRELIIKDEERNDDHPEVATAKGKTRRQEGSAIGVFRGQFWAHLVARHPTEATHGHANRASSRWRPVTDTDLVVVKYLSKRGVGVFIRGGRGADRFEIADQFTPSEKKRLSYGLGAPFNNEQYMFHKWMPCDGEDRSNWDRMADWLKAEADRYDATLTAALN